jgi:hypothetical protein
MSVANIGGDVARFTGAALTAAFGVTATDFRNLWAVVLLRILCCAIPAALALVCCTQSTNWSRLGVSHGHTPMARQVLVPRGSVLEAADEFWSPVAGGDRTPDKTRQEHALHRVLAAEQLTEGEVENVRSDE